MSEASETISRAKRMGCTREDFEACAQAFEYELSALKEEGKTAELKEHELRALENAVIAAEELVDKIYDCPDIQIIGCDFEGEFIRLRAALSKLPRYYEEGRYLWQEVDRDFRHDAPGG